MRLSQVTMVVVTNILFLLPYRALAEGTPCKCTNKSVIQICMFGFMLPNISHIIVSILPNMYCTCGHTCAYPTQQIRFCIHKQYRSFRHLQKPRLLHASHLTTFLAFVLRFCASIFSNHTHPQKLTWNMKMNQSKRSDSYSIGNHQVGSIWSYVCVAKE